MRSRLARSTLKPGQLAISRSDEASCCSLATADANAKVGGLTVLLECKPLLILAAALACFHLGNGAMLPLYGMAVVAAGMAMKSVSDSSEQAGSSNNTAMAMVGVASSTLIMLDPDPITRSFDALHDL